MSIANKIAKDQTCINYARKIGGKLHQDIFNDAIEKIIKQEQKGKVFNEKYRSYFYLTLVSVKNDIYRAKKITEVELIGDNQITHKEDKNLYEQALTNFINKRYTDYKQEMARTVTELSLMMDKKEICERIGCSLPFIYQYIDIAKQMIKHEYDRIIHY